MPYKDKQLVQILAIGHGGSQMCRVDRFGFLPTGPKQRKRVKGFQTGDKWHKAGTSVGKVAVSTRGSFNITTMQGVVTVIHHHFCVLIVRGDGYTFQRRKEAELAPTA